MDLSTINGIPAHVLLVHAVVILVPLSAVLTVGCSLWPALRVRMGIITPLLAFVAMAMVPVTTEAGEWLQRHLVSTPLIEKHVDLADGLLPWVVGLFAVAAVQWGYFRFVVTGNGTVQRRTAKNKQDLSAVIVLSVLAVVASVGSTVEVYRIGDSGAKAVWTGSFSPTQVSGGQDGD